MSGHTPGPWEVEANPFGQFIIVGAEREWVVLGTTNKSDARLIVAAPDLLEAAKGILAVLPTSLAVTEEELEALEPLEVAVKKAEGRT